MIDDGGSAFPVGDQSLHPLMIGISKRDWFAGMATDDDVARLCLDNPALTRMAARYLHADLMLAERKREEGQ